jgi:hypothetical protein
MKTLRTVCFCGLSVCFMTVACGSSKSSPSGASGTNSSGTNSGGGACKSYVACDFLSAAEVNQALGTTLPAGVEADAVVGGGLPNDYVCEFMSSDHLTGVNLSIGCNVGGLKNGPDLYTAVVRSSATPVNLAGADAAYWTPASGDAGLFDGSILEVFFGGSSSFGLTIFWPTAGPDPAAVQALGAVVLKKL